MAHRLAPRLDSLTLSWPSALLSGRGKLGFGFLIFEPGSGEQLAADTVQRPLARSIERRNLSLGTRIGHRAAIRSPREIVKCLHTPPSDVPSVSISQYVTTDIQNSSVQRAVSSG